MCFINIFKNTALNNLTFMRTLYIIVYVRSLGPAKGIHYYFSFKWVRKNVKGGNIFVALCKDKFVCEKENKMP